MKTFFKYLFLLVIAFTFAKADASSNNKNRKDPYEKAKIGEGPGHGKKVEEMTAGYNKAARWNPSGCWDFFASGSFIYWHVSEENLDIAQSTTSDSPGVRSLIAQDFSYKPGFKVSIGTNLGIDNWTGLAEYTRLHMSTLTSAVVPSGANASLVIEDWWVPNNASGTAANQVKSYWECNLDVLDAVMARRYYLGKMLLANPFAGLRAAWIYQKFDPSFTTTGAPNAFRNAFWKSSSWSVGARAGVDLSWECGMGFRIDATAAGSLLYKHQKVRAKTPNTANQIASKLRSSPHFIRPNTELGMGIAWGSYYWDMWGHFDILAAYEFHYWFNENGMRTLADEVSTFVASKPGDLMYHGLTLTARFDF